MKNKIVLLLLCGLLLYPIKARASNNKTANPRSGVLNYMSVDLSNIKLVPKNYYTTTTINVRNAPSESSEIVGTILFNDSVSCYAYNDKWSETIYNNQKCYVSIKYLSEIPCLYTDYSCPRDLRKSYMPYNIFNKNSNQYKIQCMAYNGNYGIRMVDGRYCVAIGNGFDIEVGDYVDITLSNGIIIPCIISDVKADKDTDKARIKTADGSIAEFIVNTSIISHNTSIMGDISYSCDEWKSNIVAIRRYEKNILK